MEVHEIIAKIAETEKALFIASRNHNPAEISDQMMLLSGYTSALDKALGDAEQEFEIKWANTYKELRSGDKPMSATAASNEADMLSAEDKGNIKRLSRYVASSWKNHTSAMARINHLNAEWNGNAKNG